MLDRLRDIFQGGGRLLRAEGHGLLVRVRRSTGWAILAGVSGMVVLLAAAGLLVAVTALMARELGWVTSLAIVSGAVGLVGAVFLLSAWIALGRSLEHPRIPAPVRAEVADATRQLRGRSPAADERSDPGRARPDAAGRAGPSTPAGSAGALASWPSMAAEYAVRHPGKVVGGAVLVAAVLGPRRTIRVASHTASLAALVSRMRDLAGPMADGSSDAPDGRPRPTTASASAAAPSREPDVVSPADPDAPGSPEWPLPPGPPPQEASPAGPRPPRGRGRRRTAVAGPA